MKKLLLFMGLAGITFFLALVMQYVAEYYDLRWGCVRCNTGKDG